MSEKKVSVIINGVDRWLKNFPEKNKIIVYAGRLNSEKGVIELIKAGKLRW